jgi:hypothetical protein
MDFANNAVKQHYNTKYKPLIIDIRDYVFLKLYKEYNLLGHLNKKLLE